MNQKINKKLERMNAGLINTIVFCIGLLIVAISFIPFANPDIKNILISVGCSLLASASVSYLTSKYLVRINRIKELIEYWGIFAIYETRQEMNRSTDTAFETLENRLDIIAWGLKSFRDGKTKIVQEKVKRGLKLRILAPDPESIFVKQREIAENEVPGQIRKTIIDLGGWIDELKLLSTNSENVQIKYYDKLPEDFYFRVDDSIFIGPYLYGKSSQQTISYEFKGPSHGFTYYNDYFEKLWADDDFCA